MNLTHDEIYDSEFDMYAEIDAHKQKGSLMSEVELFNEDCITGLANRIADNSIHLTVTSIPFETLNKIVAIYTDGGVIKKNPSSIGGTWAWCGVDADSNRIIERSGVVPCPSFKTITNNHTEQIAITLALEAMPDGWSGIVYSDSMIALGRVFKGWREKNLPSNISKRSAKAVARLGRIETILLQGHPTKKDLECGIGKKRGFPVSIHNVWCDKACQKESENYLQNSGK